jgi:hypothetical protein
MLGFQIRHCSYRLKTRLYSIITFLGLLPLIGAALALTAMAISERDDAALDRAARGTIHLERINGAYASGSSVTVRMPKSSIFVVFRTPEPRTIASSTAR